MAYCLSVPNFFTPDVDLPESPCINVDMLSVECQNAVLAIDNSCTKLSIVPHATINGIKYCTNMIIVSGCSNGLPEFAKIVNVVLLSNTVFLMVSNVSSWYCEHIRGYFIEGSSGLHLIEPGNLLDYYPLVPYTYGGSGKRCVVLKHFICTSQ